MKHLFAAGVLALATLISPAQAQEESTATTAPEITEMALGPEDASVTVMEYASFTCPHCANFHKGPFKQLKADYIDTGKVRFVYRDVYFDRFGLWASMVETCLNDRDKAQALVGWYQENAEAHEVNSTPTLIIDGQKYSNMPYDELKAIIDEKLAAG